MTREEAIYEIKQLVVLSTNKNIEHITEALNMAIEALQDEIWKDEPCDKCVFVKGSGWCDNCNGKPKGLDALPNSRKAKQTDPQYDAEEVAKDINRRVEMIKKEWDIRHTETNVEMMSCEECKHYVYQLGCTHHGNCAYKHEDEPQTDCSWK